MAKRRANGEGNLRKRTDGRWEGRYTAGYDPETGKCIIKNVLGKTQAEAKEKLDVQKPDRAWTGQYAQWPRQPWPEQYHRSQRPPHAPQRLREGS